MNFKNIYTPIVLFNDGNAILECRASIYPVFKYDLTSLRNENREREKKTRLQLFDFMYYNPNSFTFLTIAESAKVMNKIDAALKNTYYLSTR